MNYKSKYRPKKILKQYNTGGYGNADYGSNTYEAQYHADRINKLNNTTNEEYNKNQNDLQSSYINNIQSGNKEIFENMKLQSQVKSGINLALSGKMENGISYNQNINDWATNKLGLNRGEVNTDFSRDLSGGYDASSTTLNDPGGIGQYATDQGLSDAELRYQEANPEVSSAAGAGISQAGSQFVTKVPGSELGTPLNLPTGGGSADILSSFPVNKAPAPTAPVSAPPAGTPPPTVAPTTVKTPKALSASNAPIKGGPWTMAVDMGLNYLSNDNDVSTYTAGEVGTDLASLALNAATFNWMGVGMKMWDMGSQLVGRNKAVTRQKTLEKKLRKDKIELGNEYTQDMHANSKRIGSHKANFGKRAVYGSGELGGFNYNI